MNPLHVSTALAGAAAIACAGCHAGATPTQPPDTLQAQVQCAATPNELVYDCTVRLRDRQSRPVQGASFMVTAHMPSMPMAHNVAPVPAQPGGEPGLYRARLALEMPGRWRVELRLTQPVRTTLGQSLEFL